MPTDPDLSSWLTPRWWVDSGVTEISRDVFVSKWAAAAVKPKPESKVFVSELKSWSGELGRRSWIEELFDKRVAALASVDTKIAFDEPDKWDTFSKVLEKYGDPLARFSGGFRTLAHERRPTGLPNRLSGEVREMARKVPPLARTEMISAHDDGVIDTQLAADQFVVDPHSRHDAVAAVAMRGYTAILRDYVSTVRSRQGAGWGSDTAVAQVLESFECRIAELIEDFGEPDSAARELTAAEVRHVDRLLEQALHDNPHLFEQHTEVYIGEAWRRARQTLRDWTVKGVEVTHAGILFTKLASVRKDYELADRKRLQRERPSETVSDSEPDDRGVFASGDTGPELTEHRVDLGQILAAARETLEGEAFTDPAGACWERDFAIKALTDGGIGFVAGDFMTIGHLVAAAWGSSIPVNAKSNTSKQAATQVEFMLRRVVQNVSVRDDLFDRHSERR